MWSNIARIILRNRITFLVLIGILTVFMGYNATKVEPMYQMSGLLPADHPVTIEHEQFVQQYGHDGTVLVLGVQHPDLYELEQFKGWVQLGKDLQTIDGIDSVFSIANLYTLSINESKKQYDFEPLMKKMPEEQAEIDSLRKSIAQLPFYKDLLTNDSTDVHIMMVFVDGDKFNSNRRGNEIDSVNLMAERYAEKFNVDVRYSGMPYIRIAFTKKVKEELKKFLVLAFSVTTIILFLFFRSFKVTLFSMLVVSVGVIFSLGLISIFDYRLSMLMGLIPPLMTVIGVPNCVYLLNKYQAEYRMHGNKIKALTRVIRKVGNATFMTNTTTALGFATFIFTESPVLQQFGVIASICIMVVFILSILLIPIIFSYLDGPKERHTRHLQTPWINASVNTMVKWSSDKRPIVYISTVAVIALGFLGLVRIQTTGNMVDDLPSDDPILEDLQFFESNFNGVMPFEILVDVREPKRIASTETMYKIEDLQELLTEYPEFSRSISVVDAIKFAHQSFYSKYPVSKYSIPDKNNAESQVRIKLPKYIKNTFAKDTSDTQNFFIDKDQQSTRISVNIRDIGTIKMDSLLAKLNPQIDSIFNPGRAKFDSLVHAITQEGIGVEQKATLVDELYDSKRIRRFVEDYYATKNAGDTTFLYALQDYPDSVLAAKVNESDFNGMITDIVEDQYYRVSLTGSSVVFLEGTNYLVRNLFISLLIAVIIIAIIMALLFRSIKMVLVSLLPNLIPLLFTGAIMGYFGIPIKPSTILVFSIAFGISIDDTIHFLAKYRQELKSQSWNIKESVIKSLRETGVSMIYTSIILFFGFIMFTASSFGGIVALGALVSVTLLVAMVTNLVLLPSLLLTLDKRLTNKAFREPLLQIIDEEEDIELDDLVVQRIEPKSIKEDE